MLPEAANVIEDEAFAGISAASVWIPDGCASIGAGAFKSCPNLEKVRIPASVTSIGAGAFLSCGDSFTIYGVTGSAAEAYAAQNGFAFVALNSSTHALEKVNAVEAACQDAGNIEQVKKILGGDPDGKISTLLDTDISWSSDFSAMFNDIKRGCENLLQRLGD